MHGHTGFEGAACAQDIDDILARRTEKRQLGNSKGNTFSTATFSAAAPAPAQVLHLSSHAPLQQGRDTYTACKSRADVLSMLGL